METAPRKMSNDDNVSFLTVVGCCLLFALAIYGFYRLYVDVDSFADLIVYSTLELHYNRATNDSSSMYRPRYY